MIDTLNTVIGLASKRSGIPIGQLNEHSAIGQELGLSGDDVTWFVADLAEKYGDCVWSWPWQRFAKLDEPTLLDVPGAIWRLVKLHWQNSCVGQNEVQRLELGHIVFVIDSEHWVDP